MTEKRFTHKKWYNERQLFDGDEPFAIVDVYIQAVTICNKLNELAEENQRLRNFKEKSDKFTEEVENFFKKHNIDTVNFDLMEEEFELYRKENKELQERNNRQCKQLGDLYRLIEEKDWRALTDILDDFKKADEQLQKEWKCYE